MEKQLNNPAAPDSLESLVHILNTQENILLVYLNMAVIDDNRHVVTRKLKSDFSSLRQNEAVRLKAIWQQAKGFDH